MSSVLDKKYAELPDWATKKRKFEDEKFKKEERAMERRNLEKQALAGAKAMYKFQYEKNYKWTHLCDEIQKEYIQMAKACIKASHKIKIEV